MIFEGEWRRHQTEWYIVIELKNMSDVEEGEEVNVTVHRKDKTTSEEQATVSFLKKDYYGQPVAYCKPVRYE